MPRVEAGDKAGQSHTSVRLDRDPLLASRYRGSIGLCRGTSCTRSACALQVRVGSGPSCRRQIDTAAFIATDLMFTRSRSDIAWR